MKYESMKLTRQGAKFSISNSSIALCGETPGPWLPEGPACELDFADAGSEQMQLAGATGKVIREVSETDGIVLTREFFLADDGRYIGLRLGIENTSSQAVRLGSLTPFTVRSDENLQIAGGGMETWRVLHLTRGKAGIPGSFRPWRKDIDYEDALIEAASNTPGLVSAGQVDERRDGRTIFSEPATFIKNETQPDKPGLFMGLMNEREHVGTFYLIPSADNSSLDEFGVVCDFDSITLAPCQQRKTHWVFLFQAQTEAEALSRFADLQLEHLNISAPGERLNVFCSWYFYGREFLPADLDENLAILKDRPLPIDVFIIDNGWIDAFGDWNANEKWPDGMAVEAQKIRAAGMIPGIWTAPFALMKNSQIAQEHPEMIAKDINGGPATFGYVEGECYLLDPTHPFAEEYLREYLGRLKSWGFTFHKLDFVTNMFGSGRCFHDPHATRADAFRRGIEIIRDVLGPDVHMQLCGGLQGAGVLDIVDSLRVGADSLGNWEHYFGTRKGGMLAQCKQAMVRTYLGKLVETDPDSIMLRRRTEPFRKHVAAKHDLLSDGKFTDAEAFTLVVRQYTTGGCTNMTERMAELTEDRRALYRHMIPAFGPPADVLDFEHENCPTLLKSFIEPKCRTLDPWFTLAVCNWDEQPTSRTLTLCEAGFEGQGPQAVFEFQGQQFLGIKTADDLIELEIPAHGTRLLRIAPWEGRPLIVGTDLHLSGGGAELADVMVTDKSICGKVTTDWDYPVKISAVFRGGDGVELVSTTVAADEEFCLSPSQ